MSEIDTGKLDEYFDELVADFKTYNLVQKNLEKEIDDSEIMVDGEIALDEDNTIVFIAEKLKELNNKINEIDARLYNIENRFSTVGYKSRASNVLSRVKNILSQTDETNEEYKKLNDISIEKNRKEYMESEDL